MLSANRRKATLKQFGWRIKEGNQQIYGSSSDIYAELLYQDVFFFLRIDDGNVKSDDYVYNIYCNNLDGKIFEGRISNKEDLTVVMKCLGFDETCMV